MMLQNCRRFLLNFSRNFSSARNEIFIEPLEKSHIDEVHKLFMQTFIKDDPFSRCRGVTEADASDHFYDIVVDSVQEKFSYVAKDSKTKKVLGFGLNGIYDATHPPEFPEHIRRTPPVEELLRIVVGLYEFCFKELPEGSKVFDFKFAAVDHQHQKRGIANILLKARLERAHKENCTHAMVCPSGPITYHMYRNKLGFEEIKRIPYRNFPWFVKGRGFDENFLSVLVKKL